MCFYDYLEDEEVQEIFENFADSLNSDQYYWKPSAIAKISALDAIQHMDRVMKIMAPDIQRLWDSFKTVTGKNRREVETRTMFTTLINTKKFTHFTQIIRRA